MSGKRARYYRQAVYGTDGSIRDRRWESTHGPPRSFRYKISDRIGATGKVIGETIRTIWSGTVRADFRRRTYQKLKRSRRGMCWKVV